MSYTQQLWSEDRESWAQDARAERRGSLTEYPRFLRNVYYSNDPSSPYPPNPTRAPMDDASSGLVEHYPIIEAVVTSIVRSLPHNVAQAYYDDLLQCAMIGVADALPKYNPSTQVPMNRWLAIRARGAAIDFLRSVDVLSRGARAAVKRASRVDKLAADLARAEQSNEVRPDHIDKALAQEGLSKAKYEEGKELQSIALGWVIASNTGSGPEGDDSGVGAGAVPDRRAEADPEKCLEKRELRDQIEIYLTNSGLTPKQEQAVRLYFLEEKMMKEVAAEIGDGGVVESRASQLVSEGITKIRKKFGMGEVSGVMGAYVGGSGGGGSVKKKRSAQ